MNDYRLVLLLWLTLSSLAQAGAPGPAVDIESEAERSQLTPVHPETTSNDTNEPLSTPTDINQVLESLGITGMPAAVDEPPSSAQDTSPDRYL